MARNVRSPDVTAVSAVRRGARGEAQAGAKSLVLPRAIARAIDTIVVGAPALLVGAVLGQALTLGFAVTVLLAAYLYETIAVAGFGATLGKAWMGLEVVDAGSGARPQLSRAGTRILFVLAVSGAIQMLVPIGPAAAVFLWGSATTAADGRGLPDTVAGTHVRRRR